jgi:putative glutamine amidotransferase
VVYLISQNIAQGPYRPHDALEQTYQLYFGKRAALVPVPNLASRVPRLVKELRPRGIILTGGRTDADALTEKRDTTERTLLDLALEREIPVLGVCRGLQFINRYFGGSVRSMPGHVATTHAITLIDTDLHGEFGTELRVNSYHNDAVVLRGLSPHLQACAVADAEIVELLKHKYFPIAAVQWHPERENTDQALIDKLTHAFFEKRLYWRSARR